MNKLALFAFIKDEFDIIRSFIDHHIKIFDEIHIVDDGSTDGTVDIIKEYSKINLYQINNSFNFKGGICSDIMRSSDADILVPLDADEKMIYDDNSTISKDSQVIKQYLQNLSIDGYKYIINKIYEYHPDNDNWWYPINSPQKIIFPKKTFVYTDQGFHRGRVSLDDPESFKQKYYWRLCSSNGCIKPDKLNKIHISYLHYHFRSKEIWLKNIEKKLKQRIGEQWNNIQILNNYEGPSSHLKHSLIEYLSSSQWHELKKNKYIDYNNI